MSIVEIAKEISRSVHSGHRDHAGVDYFSGHISHVASNVRNGLEKAVAYLHDSVEDSDMTIEDLNSRLIDGGASERDAAMVVDAVDAITKRDNESYDSYLYRVRSNSLARAVKIADLNHNMDLSRIPSPKFNDYRRVEKYRKAMNYLK